MRSITRLVYAFVSAMVIWYALTLQFQFVMVWAKNHNAGFLGGLWSFVSFFTNLSNLLAGVSLTIALVTRFDPAILKRHSSTLGAIALYICMAGIIFNLKLSQTVPKNGDSYLVNVLLHDVTPFLYTAFWALWVPYRGLTVLNCLAWLGFPLLYFAHVLARGALIGQYPYAFFNSKLLGYQAVIMNGAVMLAGFLIVGLLLIGVDRLKLRWESHPMKSYQR